MNTPEIVLKVPSILGEGPCWDDRNNCLYWIDILGEKICRYDPATGKNTAYPTGQSVGCIVLCGKGGLVCAMQNGIYRFEPGSGIFEKLLDRPDSHIADNRFNDGKCDPAGRLFAGTMSSAQNEGRGRAVAGTLFRIGPDLRAAAVIRHVSISNGLAWHSDCTTMYYIDTPTMEVSAFDYDLGTGNIQNRRAILDFRHESGIPDGMAIDAEDMLWIAHWGGSKISRWNPVTGSKLGEIMLPCRNVTCCAFGGADFSDLYITTARIGLTDDELTTQPLAGSLFRVKADTPGRASNRFAG